MYEKRMLANFKETLKFQPAGFFFQIAHGKALLAGFKADLLLTRILIRRMNESILKCF